MDAKKKFGQELKAYRQKSGLTQEALAELIDRSVDTISNIERGTSGPSHETLRRLSKVFGLSLEELSGWSAASPAPVDGDPERAQLVARLWQIVAAMDTPMLRVAVGQLSVLTSHLRNEG